MNNRALRRGIALPKDSALSSLRATRRKNYQTNPWRVTQQANKSSWLAKHGRAIERAYRECRDAMNHDELVDSGVPGIKERLRFESFDFKIAHAHNFVCDVIATPGPGFDLSDPFKPKATPLSHWLATFKDWVPALAQPDWTFSAEIQLIQEVWVANGWAVDRFSAGKPLALVAPGTTAAASFNALIDTIRKRAEGQEFHANQRARQQTSRRHERRLKFVTTALFRIVGRLMVARVDFGYRKDVVRRVTLAQAKADMERFLNNRRHNSLFKHLVGYAWRLEHTVDRGFHYHVALFFDGSQVNRHQFYAQQALVYWKESITGGLGWGHNSNMDEKRIRKAGKNFGIGMVDHHDIAKREALDEALCYLAKADQFVVAKSLRGQRCFMARILVKPKTGVGRPRTRGQVQSSGN